MTSSQMHFTLVGWHRCRRAAQPKRALRFGIRWRAAGTRADRDAAIPKSGGKHSTTSLRACCFPSTPPPPTWYMRGGGHLPGGWGRGGVGGRKTGQLPMVLKRVFFPPPSGRGWVRAPGRIGGLHAPATSGTKQGWQPLPHLESLALLQRAKRAPSMLLRWTRAGGFRLAPPQRRRCTPRIANRALVFQAVTLGVSGAAAAYVNFPCWARRRIVQEGAPAHRCPPALCLVPHSPQRYMSPPRG